MLIGQQAMTLSGVRASALLHFEGRFIMGCAVDARLDEMVKMKRVARWALTHRMYLMGVDSRGTTNRSRAISFFGPRKPTL
jgi:hypothetical protein